MKLDEGKVTSSRDLGTFVLCGVGYTNSVNGPTPNTLLWN